MKILPAILCASSLLYSASAEEAVSLPLDAMQLEDLSEVERTSENLEVASALQLISSEAEEAALAAQNEEVQNSAEEIVVLDTSSFMQQSLPPSALETPEPIFKPPHKSPFLAVGLSIVPGFGHMYLGDMKTAGALLGSAGVSAATLLSFKNSKEAYEASSTTLAATCFYSVYAAYRDVRLYNGVSGYSYRMPTDSFTDLTSAPFSPSILKKPEVWGGLLGTFAVVIGASYVYSKAAHVRPMLATVNLGKPLLALPVGIGEEAFFRGFLQSWFSEGLSPWGGIALSSLLFGAAHIGNARDFSSAERRQYYRLSIPLITSIGAYFGWLTYKNHSLKESTALHTLYDFVLFGLEALASEASISKNSSFAIAIPF